ncbi:MAG: SCO family protein [Ramlibacter sp.]|jgi:protein SCO1/2
MQRRFVLHATAASLLAGALAACGKAKPPFKSVDVTGADHAKDFQLTDHLGQPRKLADFRGKAVVVFFGFTQCPDVCPSTLMELAQVKRELGADGDKVQGIFITVDPVRDTPEVLKGYMALFGPDFLALHGTPAQIEATARDFKVFYKKVEGKTATSYTMEHSAASFVYDTQGRLRLYVRPGSGPQVLADDLRLLLSQS